MSRFGNNTKTLKIELGDGEWIEVKQSLPFKVLQPLIAKISESQGNQGQVLEQIIPLVKIAVTDWQLVDDDGEKVPFKQELIDELDFETIMDLNAKISDLYFPTKKNLPGSEE